MHSSRTLASQSAASSKWLLLCVAQHGTGAQQRTLCQETRIRPHPPHELKVYCSTLLQPASASRVCTRRYKPQYGHTYTHGPSHSRAGSRTAPMHSGRHAHAAHTRGRYPLRRAVAVHLPHAPGNNDTQPRLSSCACLFLLRRPSRCHSDIAMSTAHTATSPPPAVRRRCHAPPNASSFYKGPMCAHMVINTHTTVCCKSTGTGACGATAATTTCHLLHHHHRHHHHPKQQTQTTHAPRHYHISQPPQSLARALDPTHTPGSTPGAPSRTRQAKTVTALNRRAPTVEEHFLSKQQWTQRVLVRLSFVRFPTPP